MPKFTAHAMYTASKYLGTFEAGTKAEALKMADAKDDTYVTLCHQCADDVELGDYYEIQIDEA